MTLTRLGSDWLRNARDHGTILWDYTITRLIAVVLVAALRIRGGDVTRSRFYHGLEYMKWADVALTMEAEVEGNVKEEALWQSIKGHIMVRWG